MEADFPAANDMPVAATAPGALVRASSATFAAGITSIIVGLVRSKIVALLLGPFGIGAIASMSMFINAATVIASSAAGPGAVRALAAMRSGELPDNRAWLERFMFVGPLVLAVVITAIAVVLAEPVALVLLGQQDLAYAVLLICAAIPVAVIAASYTNFLQALLRIGTIARADIVTTIVSLPLTVGLVLAFGLSGAILAIGAAFGVRLIALRAFSPSVAPRGDWSLSLRPPSGALRTVLAIGSAGAVLGMASVIGTLLIRAELVRSLGLVTNGLYQPIVALSESYLDILIAGASAYLFPLLTELIGRGDRAGSERELGHGLRLTLALSVPLMLVTIGMSDLVVRLLYSNEFAVAAWPLSVQMAGTILKVATVSVGVALLPLGLTRAWVVIGVLVVALRYAGVVLLAPGMGLLGVALASDLAWAVGAAAILVTVWRSGRLGVAGADMMRTALAGGLVLMVLGARALDSTSISSVVTVIALAAWLFVARRELAALVAGTLAGIRPRRPQAG